MQPQQQREKIQFSRTFPCSCASISTRPANRGKAAMAISTCTS